jgi:hypothetical protein
MAAAVTQSKKRTTMVVCWNPRCYNFEGIWRSHPHQREGGKRTALSKS